MNNIYLMTRRLSQLLLKCSFIAWMTTTAGIATLSDARAQQTDDNDSLQLCNVGTAGTAYGRGGTTPIECQSAGYNTWVFSLTNRSTDNGLGNMNDPTARGTGYRSGLLELVGTSVSIIGPASFSADANFNNNKITNLANGIADKDAANISQLKGALSGLGGGTGLDKDGTVKKPSYTVGGKTYDNVKDALAHMQTAPEVENPYIKISPLHGIVDTESRAAGDIAIGPGAIVDSQAKDDGLHHASAIGIGEEAGGFGENSIAIGTHAFVGSRNGKMRTDSSIALGAYASVTRKNAVALGFRSQADRANAVSVGSPDALRQIIYVGKGTADTDAVNVSQLKGALDGLGGGAGLDKDGTVKKPSYTINGKAYNTVGDALANVQAGPGADSPYIKIDGDTPASNNVSGGISIGSNTKAEGITGGRGTIAIGQNAISRDARGYTAGIAIGLSSVAESGAVALGPEAQATQTNGVALGTLSVADREGSGSGSRAISGVSVGSKDVKRKIYNVASGTLNDEVVIIAQLKGALDSLGGGAGLNTDGTVKAPSYTVNGKTYTTVGDALANVQAGPGAENPYIKIQPTDHKNATEAKSPGDIAIGHGAVSESKGNNDAPHTSSVAIGELANVYGASGTALVSHTTIGTADKRVDNGVAIGDQSQVLANNSIAIGTQSSADRANVVSIGHNKLLRQLIYLAKGTADTDGVNVSQLKGVLAGLGGGAALDKDGNVKAPAYTVGGKNYSSVSDAFAHVQAGEPGAGEGLVKQDPASKDIMVAQALDGKHVNFAGKKADQSIDRVLTGVADGVKRNDAATIHQLQEAHIIDKNGAIADVVTNDNQSKNEISFGGKQGTGLHNIADGSNDGDAVNMRQLNKALKERGGKSPNAVNYDSAEKDWLTFGRAQGTVLANVKPGEISQTSTQAVNGRQFFTLQQQVNVLDGRVSDLNDRVGDGHGGRSGGGNNGENGSFSGGNNADASGDNSTALGQDAVASGKNSTATSQGAIASGLNSKADGQNARATGDNSTAIGQNALTSGKDSTALGQNASATGPGSLALGQNAKAPAANAVVLGKDSVADRDNTISVGAEGRERAIANVAPGEKGTDAVNVNQLNQGLGDTLAKARQYTDEKFKEQRRESQAGSASAIAIAGLPQATAPGKSMVAVSSGLYRRESAIALGISTVTEDNSWVFKLSGSANFRGRVSGVVGAGYQW